MSRTDRTIRSANLAITASTLVALMAIASGTTSGRGLPARLLHLEMLGSMSEAQAVRVAAAVVAAATRDLITTPAPAPGVLLPELDRATDVAHHAERPRWRIAAAVPPVVPPVGEYLLDLPPPVCA